MAVSSSAIPTEAQRAAARRIADDLRAVGELLAVRDIPVEMLDDVSGALRAARARLEECARRPRWYEVAAPDEHGRALSKAFHDEYGPLRGAANPIAPPLEVSSTTRPDGSFAVAGRARLGLTYEGPPRMVHGGWTAALFDELLAVVQRDAQVGGLTASLTVRYRKPTPVGQELELLGWIDEDQGRTVVARATCHAGGELVAEAEAHFVRAAGARR